MHAIIEQALGRAEALLHDARRLQHPNEQAQARQLQRLVDDPAGKAFTLALVDRVFRSRSPARQARQLRAVIGRYGVPAFLPAPAQWLLRMAGRLTSIMPYAVMTSTAAQLRRASRSVILPAEPDARRRYLAARQADGTRVNINQLGEAVLGEQAARHHIARVQDLLSTPGVTHASVKISALFSQINTIAWNDTLHAIKDRLRPLYRLALARGKFVNLDMEEYRDLELTLAAFQQLLDEPEFHALSAGLALQAYIPDSWQALQQLTDWAIDRRSLGRAPVKVRLVKGANLPMELVEAELHGWQPATYPTKHDTDANYRRMMEYACRPDHIDAVHVGIASHNLFDVALALAMRDTLPPDAHIDIEMLEGMANHQARAVQRESKRLLVYAPLARREDFINTMAYLVRRLEENTSPENFLHDIFSLAPGTPAWDRQRDRFIAGWNHRHTVSAQSRRALPAARSANGFQNAPDTDWTQPIHRQALYDAIDRWHQPDIPPIEPLETVLHRAVDAQRAWEARGFAARAECLMRCADVMEGARFVTMAQMMHDGKKSPAESDAEISEAIDFARYNASLLNPVPGVSIRARGVVTIAPPWNFPYSIPAGGVLAALAMGNSVILKPAPETVQTAWLLVQQLWQAGIPRDVLQFFPCADGDIGRALMTDPRTSAVVLTGAYDTARLFQRWRPSLPLFAETSGKNAIVVTAHADRDLAIRDIVRSAFGHAGQKCSAASLAILDAELYDDEAFLQTLRDAAASLPTGPASDLRSVVTPLIRPAGEALHRALTSLDPGESWLLQPSQSNDDPCLWSPGIRLGTSAGSWFHLTECFGPVLGIMRAANLDEAIRMQNAVPFGLTGGIHSLNDDEIAHWKAHVQVGNAYINRSITGAVVQRQPFGGWKQSSIGPGAKAGGPDYLCQFAHISDDNDALDDYAECWQTVFNQETDPSALACESNGQRYLPSAGVLLRGSRSDEIAIARARRASAITGTPLLLSLTDDESDSALAARLPAIASSVAFLRTLRAPADALLLAVAQCGINWIDAPMVARGRYELPRWLRPQSVSQSRHRYGLIQPHTRSAVGIPDNP